MTTSKIQQLNYETNLIKDTDEIFWYRYGRMAFVLAKPKQRTIAAETIFQGIPIPHRPFEFVDSRSGRWYIGTAGGEGAIKPETAISGYNSFCIAYPIA